MRFRQRLVTLIDELIDDPPARGTSFLLDGQAIVAEDYLAVRPERVGELSALLHDGRLEAGPWYVLADTLIPSGEAIVRNLLVGRRILRALRAESPPALYCPDSFGHPAALPVIADGFGLPLIILWRGFGSRRWPNTDRFIWRAQGAQAVAYHLPRDGYETGSSLPYAAAAAVERWQRLREPLLGRARGDVVLLPNGADHHARQLHQQAAVEALARAAARTGDAVMPSSLRAFTQALLDETREPRVPVVEGELRDSYGFTWTLQGTFATRAAQKRRNARVERLLLREAEPWAALARRAGGSDRMPLLVAAWKSLLEAHPHDTLCGCSIDAVAAAMDRRLADARAQGRGIRADAIADVVGHDPGEARDARARWRPMVIVRNAAPRARGGVAFVELERFVADVPVGPGSAPSPDDAGASRSTGPAAAPRVAGVAGVQPLGTRTLHRRTESARHYPDDDLVDVTRAAIWCPPVAGYGTRTFALDADPPPGDGGDGPRHPVVSGDRALENGRVRIHVAANGEVRFTDIASGRTVRSLFTLEDRVDAGDLYTPSIRGVAADARLARVRELHAGPLVGEMRITWQLRTRGEERGSSTISIALRLLADSPIVLVRITGTNRRTDHRLRIGIRSGIADADVWADAAFGPVRRRPPDALPDEDLAMETPPPTAPLHRYVSLFDGERGATVFSDGLAEYEIAADGTAYVSILRAVGELSRNDLRERPGHAAWPASTPHAQSQGPYAANLALLFHGPRTPAVIGAIEHAADDVLLPLAGSTLRSALRRAEPTHGVELQGDGLAFSAMKPSEDGMWTVLRCVNLLDTPVRGAWRFGVPLEAARLARLDEAALDPLVLEGATVRFDAGPRAVVTLLVR